MRGARRRGVDHRARGGRAVFVEQVVRREHLRVGVVGRAATAQPTAGRQHPRVGHQQRDAVVVARRRDRRQLREGFGGRVPELGDQHRGAVVPWFAEGVATDDQHLAVRQHDTVAEDACIRHRHDLAHRHAGVHVDHISAVARIAALVSGRAAGLEHLADVVHHCVAALAVEVVAARAGRRDRAIALGVDPVHVGSRAGVQHFAVRGREQPHVVVGAEREVGVVAERGIDRHAGQALPAGRGGPALAVFVAAPAAPRAAERQHRAVLRQRVGVVAARDRHHRPGGPGVRHRIVDAGLGAVLAAIGEDAAVGQIRRAGAEHVVAGVGHQRLGRGQRRRVEERGVGPAARRPVGEAV